MTRRRTSQPSRRQFLTGFGMAGVSTAIACLFGGTAGALWLATRPDEPQVITITNTPSATSTPTIPQPAMVSRAEWGALPPNHEARNEKGFYDPDENVNGWRIYEGELATNYQTLVIQSFRVFMKRTI